MRPHTILISLFLLAYVATASGDTPKESPIYWIQPITNSNSNSPKPSWRDSIQAQGRIKGYESIPGSGFNVPFGFDTWRICSTAYFMKNTIVALIRSLEYQKQMALMLHVIFDSGQFPVGAGGVSSVGGVQTAGQSGTGGTTTVSTTTSSTTQSTTTTTAPSVSSSNTTPPTNQTVLTPEQVQELLSLVSEILSILPEILERFAALEEANNGNSNDPIAADVPTYINHSHELAENRKNAVERLHVLQNFMKDMDLKPYTTKLGNNSHPILVEVVQQAIADISMLAPKDDQVYKVAYRYGDILLRMNP